MKFNRWLATVVNDINIIFEKVKFLLVQLRFLDVTQPRTELFDEDNRLLLSNTGAELFRRVVFQLAGFVKNE